MRLRVVGPQFTILGLAFPPPAKYRSRACHLGHGASGYRKTSRRASYQNCARFHGRFYSDVDNCIQALRLQKNKDPYLISYIGPNSAGISAYSAIDHARTQHGPSVSATGGYRSDHADNQPGHIPRSWGYHSAIREFPYLSSEESYKLAPPFPCVLTAPSRIADYAAARPPRKQRIPNFRARSISASYIIWIREARDLKNRIASWISHRARLSYDRL